MNLVRRQVMVEYVFDGVSDEILPHLPSRVREAVEHLVGADELPSDAAVRSRVFSEGGGETAGGRRAGGRAAGGTGPPTR